MEKEHIACTGRTCSDLQGLLVAAGSSGEQSIVGAGHLGVANNIGDSLCARARIHQFVCEPDILSIMAGLITAQNRRKMKRFVPARNSNEPRERFTERLLLTGNVKMSCAIAPAAANICPRKIKN